MDAGDSMKTMLLIPALKAGLLVSCGYAVCVVAWILTPLLMETEASYPYPVKKLWALLRLVVARLQLVLDWMQDPGVPALWRMLLICVAPEGGGFSMWKAAVRSLVEATAVTAFPIHVAVAVACCLATVVSCCWVIRKLQCPMPLHEPGVLVMLPAYAADPV
ncbi:hypothetical protein Nepgr_027270 [Nepenthes gracilis]|uniref:Uncharacterized protein n=1 Tax=Nepenthes gracilis TaxID=150966 RepID=A0AAD3TBF9_NEPGR|nr:hypothetical protein Nepgr_027270 [Nepenthes gracilis]